MSLDSLQELLEIARSNPLGAIATAAALVVVAFIGWYISAYISERGRQRAAGSPPIPSAKRGSKLDESPDRLVTRRGDDFLLARTLENGEIPLSSETFSLPFRRGSAGGAILLADDAAIEFDLSITFRVNNPYKWIYATTNHPIESLMPVVYSETHRAIEPLTVEGMRGRARELESSLSETLRPHFQKVGVLLEAVSLGPLRNRD